MKQKYYKPGQLISCEKHIYRICADPTNYECGCDICDLKYGCLIDKTDERMTKLHSICAQKFDFYFKRIK